LGPYEQYVRVVGKVVDEAAEFDVDVADGFAQVLNVYLGGVGRCLLSVWVRSC
jgi:hypothetical protein